MCCNQEGEQKDTSGKGIDCVSSPDSGAEKRDGRTGYTGQSQGEADGAIQSVSLRVMVCQEFHSEENRVYFEVKIMTLAVAYG